MRLFALTVAALLLVTSGTVSARCAPAGLSYGRIGTGDVSGTTPSLLLGATVDRRSRDEEVAPTRASLVGTGTRPLTLTAIAPGLLRASAATALPAGPYTLRGIARPFSVRVRTSPAAALTAPDVSAIRVRAQERSGIPHAEAELRTAPPAGAVAVIVSVNGAATAWATWETPPTAGTLSITSVARCAPSPPGYTVPTAGQSVTLQYVDAAGTLSPPSAAIVAR